MNQQPEDLRSCPFCLGLATLEKIEDRCYGVGCTDCDFQLMNGSVGIGWHESEQEAIAAWNERGGDLAMSQLRAWVKELQDENTALKAATQAVEPFGYVNTNTGQFFKDVEPCRKTNEGHWRTVFTAPQEQADARDADGLYYLQDARWSAMVGNCPSWWRPDGNGYTTNLDEAARFTFAEAMAQHRCRDTDLPWLCSEVDKLRRPTVDCQYMPRSWGEQRVQIHAQAAAKEGVQQG